MLLSGTIVVCALLMWSFVWLPLSDSRTELRKEAAANAAELPWLRDASARLITLSGIPTASAPTDEAQSLLTRANTSAQAAGLGASIVNAEPLETHRLRIQFSGADFDTLIAWLERTTASNAQLEELIIQRASGVGRVDAQMVLRETGE